LDTFLCDSFALSDCQGSLFVEVDAFVAIVKEKHQEEEEDWS